MSAVGAVRCIVHDTGEIKQLDHAIVVTEVGGEVVGVGEGQLGVIMNINMNVKLLLQTLVGSSRLWIKRDFKKEEVMKLAQLNILPNCMPLLVILCHSVVVSSCLHTSLPQRMDLDLRFSPRDCELSIR